jgi:hypothetical protein
LDGRFRREDDCFSGAQKLIAQPRPAAAQKFCYPEDR